MLQLKFHNFQQSASITIHTNNSVLMRCVKYTFVLQTVQNNSIRGLIIINRIKFTRRQSCSQYCVYTMHATFHPSVSNSATLFISVFDVTNNIVKFNGSPGDRQNRNRKRKCETRVYESNGEAFYCTMCCSHSLKSALPHKFLLNEIHCVYVCTLVL